MVCYAVNTKLLMNVWRQSAIGLLVRRCVKTTVSIRLQISSFGNLVNLVLISVSSVFTRVLGSLYTDQIKWFVHVQRFGDFRMSVYCVMLISLFNVFNHLSQNVYWSANIYFHMPWLMILWRRVYTIIQYKGQQFRKIQTSCPRFLFDIIRKMLVPIHALVNNNHGIVGWYIVMLFCCLLMWSTILYIHLPLYVSFHPKHLKVFTSFVMNFLNVKLILLCFIIILFKEVVLLLRNTSSLNVFFSIFWVTFITILHVGTQ